MKRLNIDDLPPVDVLKQVKHHEQWQGRPPRPCQLWNGGPRNGPGYDPQKLLDWRRLEERQHQLHLRWLELTNSLWDRFRELLIRGKEWGARIVCVGNARGPEYVMIVDDDLSLSIRPIAEFVKEMSSNPEKKAYIVDEDEAQWIVTMHERSYRALRRRDVYFRAFHLAVEARLAPYVRRELVHSTKQFLYHDEAAFLVGNQGRLYVVNSDHRGCLTWAGHAVFDCR